MKEYKKHFILGIFISLGIFLIPAAFLDPSPGDIGLLILVSPFYYGFILSYPIIVILILMFLLKKVNIILNPYVYSFSIVLYTSIVAFLNYVLEFNIIIEGSKWKLVLLSIVCCTIVILFFLRKEKR